MLRVEILCVGKLNAAFLAQGCQEYLKRLGGLADVRVTQLPEAPLNEKSAGAAAVARALEKEGAAMLARLRRTSRLVALCIEGRSLSSEELAAWLDAGATAGEGDITFAIGSSHGLAPAVKQRAALCLSMSRMTFPHQLARLMLLEQLYRALTILQGGRYHK